MEGEEIYSAGKKTALTTQRVPHTSGLDPGRHQVEKSMDLNEELIRNRAATYFFRMKGDAMRDAGIFEGDILVVDRSVQATDGKVIVAVLNGELLVRRFHRNFSSAFLIPENNRFKTINLAEFTDFLVWGVVMYAIHPVG
jgi:DNA polymerase V